MQKFDCLHQGILIYDLNIFNLQNRELEELKTAHAKRLDRLKSVQADYKILKDQLRAVETSDRYG